MIKNKYIFMASSLFLITGCQDKIESYFENMGDISELMPASIEPDYDIAEAELKLQSNDDVILSEAFAVFLNAASANDIQAQFRVGQMYLNGTGVKQDKFMALSYLKQAAAQDMLPAQNYLAKLFYDGSIIDRDLKESRFWFLRSADNYDSEAFLYLAKIAQELRDFENVEEQAIFYLEQSVNLGSVDAKFYLAQLIQSGTTTRAPDYKRAKQLFSQAAQQGVDEALIYVNEDLLSTDSMRAVDKLKMAADAGSVGAAHSLGTIFEWGLNLPQDMDRAIRWYQQSADDGNSYSAYQMALFYNAGIHLEQNYSKAVHYLTRASDSNHYIAQRELAKFYLLGKGVDKDEEKAISYLYKAVKARDPYACLLMSYFHRYGSFVPKDLQTAERLYDIALHQPGAITAHVNLAKDFIYGDILPKDIINAKKLLLIAAAAEHAEAFYLLAKLEDMMVTEPNYEKQFLYYKNAGRLGFAKAYFEIALMYKKGEGVSINESKAFYWFAKSAKLGLPQAQFQIGDMYQHGIGVKHNIVMAAVWLNISVDNRIEDNDIYSNIINSFSQMELIEFNRLYEIYKNNYSIKYSLVGDFNS